MSRGFNQAIRIAAIAAILIAAHQPAIAQSGGSGATHDGIIGALAGELRELRAYPHLDRAYRLIARNQLLDARAELERHLALQPEHAAARTAYLMLLWRLKAYAEVLEQADIVIRQRPDDSADARLYRGMANHASGRLEAASADFYVVVRTERASPAGGR